MAIVPVRIQDVNLAVSANATDRVPASQGTTVALTISVQQIIDVHTSNTEDDFLHLSAAEKALVENPADATTDGYMSSEDWNRLDEAVGDIEALKITPPGSGDVVGPATAVAGNIPVLDATGKVLTDGGKSPDDFLERIGTGVELTQDRTLLITDVSGTDFYYTGTTGRTFTFPTLTADVYTDFPNYYQGGIHNDFTAAVDITYAGDTVHSDKTKIGQYKSAFFQRRGDKWHITGGVS